MPVIAYCTIAFLAGFCTALLMVFYVGRRESRRENKRRDEALARRMQQEPRPGLWLPRSAAEREQ